MEKMISYNIHYHPIYHMAFLEPTEVVWGHESTDLYYNDVIMNTMASHSPASRLFTQLFIQAQIKEKKSKLRVTGDWWIPRTKGQ